ncbi:molecular chaperone DnaJ [Corynebacterium uberis]|uniref:molecular chaperone DnaJ n=1 Tax=Corynebacterium TaxID=1716 RepID=UPI001D0B1548|nr:molecular chaperone DnaJ [Corynebacterium uberis]MCZ9309664.1 molecular chaperone DnaJ [Corynebacterium sp. c6VSa_13]UDL73468.1 molecular chaperone DnaJ [Corynebacterium uberis]UDL75652.1 molecular chaperone DnaJ [Corynebacterium uberis]UDL77865.1 molecular chaperone DnaJ [Corynebacterium uberis]UDL80148.1 molecular chaperone DnaJ [Corynebacterium uberis]
MAEREWADKNYYADLGVSSSASQDEIKKAYRRIARENHPDKRPGDKVAEERFKKAAEAYDVIGDEHKRKEYDQLRAMMRQGGFGGAGFPGGFRSSGRTYSTQDFNVSDIFGQQGGGFSADGGLGDLFGGLFHRGGSARQSARPARGADVETDITLEFREAAKGTTLPLQLSGDAPCNTCHGSGSRSGRSETCTTCNGSGFTSESRGAFGFSSPCPDCRGTGERITDPCVVCSGTGTVKRTRSITVRIPAGVVDGQKVRLAGQGEAGPNGKPSGDLFVTVHVRPDKVFERVGDNLEVTVPVSFAELALGETITVPTLDAPVRVRVPAGTRDGRTLRVKGRGIKGGDLLVEVRVQVPEHLDAAATSALRTYAQAERDAGFRPRAGWEGAQ